MRLLCAQWIGVFLLLIAAVQHAASAQDAAKVQPIKLGDGSVTLVPPATWKVVPPKFQMIQNEFRAPKDEKEDLQARITVTGSGGSIESNIDRWKGQFEGLAKDAAKVEKKDIAGQTVHLVDLKGTYKESMAGGPFAPGPTKKLENYRMLGAIVETKASGNFFIKITGPSATVEKLNDDFQKMVLGMTSK